MIYKSFNQKQKKALNGLSAAIIRYDEGYNTSPVVEAQGKGNIANQIITLAKEHKIPLQEDSQLIGELVDLDLGDSIPPQLYSVMAEILFMLEEMGKDS